MTVVGPAPALDPTADPAFVPDAVVEVRGASVWFGPKVALSEVSCSFGPGVTGLLGPNGAGKTTLMRAIGGLIPVNQGQVRVTGHDPRAERGTQRLIALVPEDEAVPAALSARQLVRYTAALHGISDRAMPDRCARRRSACPTWPTARWAGSARACASAPRWRPPS